MNKPIRRVAFVAMVMFALLLANVTYAVLFRHGAVVCASRATIVGVSEGARSACPRIR